jgi:hypothetical protein
MAFTNPHREAEFNQWRRDRERERQREETIRFWRNVKRYLPRVIAVWLFYYGVYWLSYAVLKLMLLARSVGIPQG